MQNFIQIHSLGKGINLDTNINISDDQIKGIFSVISPNYKNTDKDLRLVFESTETDLITASGYKSSRSGFSVGTQFEQYTDLFLNIDLITHKSSRACVGCSFVPSPALRIGILCF